MKGEIEMRQNEFVDMLSTLCDKFYQQGKVVTDKYVAGYGLDIEQQKCCGLIVKLALETHYFKEETKRMLSEGLSYRKVAEMEGKNANTIKSRIYNDIGKLKKKLGENCFDTIIRCRDADVSKYITILQKLIQENSTHSLLDEFGIKIPKIENEMHVTSLSEEDMLQLCYLVTCYSKRRIKEVEKQVKKEWIAYIQYLESNRECLDENEQSIYDSLSACLRDDQTEKKQGEQLENRVSFKK